MVEPAQDYAEPETDHEEVVLTRFQKIKQWWEIASTMRKLYRIVLALFIGTSGTMAVGEITDTNPLREAALEVGLVDPAFTPKDFVDHDHNWEHEHDVAVVEPGSDHTHPHEHAPIGNQTVLDHDHPGEPHKHADHIHANHKHAPVDVIREVEAAIKSALPENHAGLH